MADEQNLDTQNPEAQAAENVAPSDDLAARVQALEEQLAAAQDQSLRMAAELDARAAGAIPSTKGSL